MSTSTTQDGTQIYFKDWGYRTACCIQPRLAPQCGLLAGPMLFLVSSGYCCIAMTVAAMAGGASPGMATR